MTIFKRKDFSKLSEIGKKSREIVDKGKGLVKKSPILPFSVGSFAVGSANLALNSKRKDQDVSYQKKQLEAMNHLTDALTNVDKSLKEQQKLVKPTVVKEEKKKKKRSWFRGKIFTEQDNMINFRRKDFSILSDAAQGAGIGAAIGSFGSIFAPDKVNNSRTIDRKTVGNVSSFKFRNKTDYKIRNNYNNLSNNQRKLAIAGAGAIIGAALGALVGLIKEGDKWISRTNVDKRLMEKVIENLKKTSFKEGTDFTRDPKIADQLKTKVCVVITKISGDLRILINTVNDKKLKDLTDQTVKNIPNSSVVNTKTSNNYNEITISTISDGSADAGLVTGICTKFIRSGYPVYLVEVG